MAAAQEAEAELIRWEFRLKGDKQSLKGDKQSAEV